jgi:flagellar basal-body rod protein FlgF
MSDFIMQLAGVMRTESDSLDALAHNAANTMTPGYRSQYPTLNATGLSSIQKAAATGSSSNSAVSNRDGALKVTGIKTHLALRGDGWFVVETKDGPRLTRNGQFHVSPEGALLDSAGNAVLADGGPLVGIDGDFSVIADGSVSARGKNIARIRIVIPNGQGDLQPAGGSLYSYSGELAASKSAAVVQGAYELSNVDTASDMLLLMRTTRHIQSLQRSISAYSGAVGNGISQLGN